jgi:hypothetical protein
MARRKGCPNDSSVEPEEGVVELLVVDIDLAHLWLDEDDPRLTKDAGGS